jgi:hypothetical protein
MSIDDMRHSLEECRALLSGIEPGPVHLNIQAVYHRISQILSHWELNHPTEEDRP